MVQPSLERRNTPIQARDTISVHVMFKKPIRGIRFPCKNRSRLFTEKSGRSKQGYDLRSTFFKFFLKKKKMFKNRSLCTWGGIRFPSHSDLDRFRSRRDTISYPYLFMFRATRLGLRNPCTKCSRFACMGGFLIDFNTGKTENIQLLPWETKVIFVSYWLNH